MLSAACLGQMNELGSVTESPPVSFAVNDIPQYSQLVLNVCETLQEEVIALFDQTRHSLAAGSATEDKDSMETDDCSRLRHKDQRDGVRGCPGSRCVPPTRIPSCELLPALGQARGGE